MIDRVRKGYEGEGEVGEELKDVKVGEGFGWDYSEYMVVEEKKGSVNKEGYG